MRRPPAGVLGVIAGALFRGEVHCALVLEWLFVAVGQAASRARFPRLVLLPGQGRNVAVHPRQHEGALALPTLVLLGHLERCADVAEPFVA